MSDMTARIGIVVVSDRASAGVYEDRGGPAIKECLADMLACPYEIDFRMIPDERPVIESTLVELADAMNCSLVVTTGGTGPAVRDVTPEATESVCEKMMPGFGEQMRAVSLRVYVWITGSHILDWPVQYHISPKTTLDKEMVVGAEGEQPTQVAVML